MSDSAAVALFRHCTRCGFGGMSVRTAREIVCVRCGYRHFLTPIAAACALVMDAQQRVLIIRRAHDPGKGMLGLPGGVVEPGETAEAAAARELREETGLAIEAAAFRYLGSLTNDYPFQDFIWPTIDLFFVAELTSDAVPAPDPDPEEVAEILWLPLDQVPLRDFAFSSNAEAVRRLANQRGMTMN